MSLNIRMPCENLRRQACLLSLKRGHIKTEIQKLITASPLKYPNCLGQALEAERDSRTPDHIFRNLPGMAQRQRWLFLILLHPEMFFWNNGIQSLEQAQSIELNRRVRPG